jgi:hypothetical protein
MQVEKHSEQSGRADKKPQTGEELQDNRNIGDLKRGL